MKQIGILIIAVFLFMAVVNGIANGLNAGIAFIVVAVLWILFFAVAAVLNLLYWCGVNVLIDKAKSKAKNKVVSILCLLLYVLYFVGGIWISTKTYKVYNEYRHLMFDIEYDMSKSY